MPTSIPGLSTADLLPEDIQSAMIPAGKFSDDPAADGIAPDSPSPEVMQFWREQLESARKRESDYRKDTRPVVRIYEAGTRQAHSYNILYANTETLLPAVYNQVPRPVVKRKQAGATGLAGSPDPGISPDSPDTLQLIATRVAQRLLDQFLDTGATDAPNFDELASQSVLQALVTGRGLLRFRYDSTIEDQTVNGETTSQLTYENVCGELVDWDRVLFGYARSWHTVPWLAFEHYMSREELVDNFGDLGRVVPLNASTSDSGSGTNDGGADADGREERAPDDSEGAKLALVYEIWDKTKKQVLFFAPSSPDTPILRQLPDPLGLSGFFPCPAPLTFFTKVSSMLPQPLYEFYREQAEELNRVSRRINKIVNALKVRGFYDSQIGNLGQLLEKPDNTLLPAENVAAMQQGQTLEKSIWLMPLTELITVLQQLYVQRTQVKALIYEITGISDIVRGASAASETLGAQKIKESWVTLRIKRLQKAVQRYLRNSLRLMAEIALSKLSPETVREMTGVDLPTPEEKAQAQMELDAWKQQQAQMQMAAVNGPMNGGGGLGGVGMGIGGPSAPGAPTSPAAPVPGPAPSSPAAPAPPAAPPAHLLTTLSTPTMQDILSLLNNDLQRRYTIDIETNSTVDAEATEDKQQVGEFLHAMSQFLSGVAPLVQNGTMPFEAAQAIMLSVTRRFRFGEDVEEALKKMQPPAAPTSDPKVEGEKKMMELEMAKGQQEMELRKQMAQLDVQLKTMELQMKEKELQMEAKLKEMEMGMKQQELQRKGQMGEMQHASKLRMMQQREEQAARQATIVPQGTGTNVGSGTNPAPEAV